MNFLSCTERCHLKKLTTYWFSNDCNSLQAILTQYCVTIMLTQLCVNIEKFPHVSIWREHLVSVMALSYSPRSSKNAS